MYKKYKAIYYNGEKPESKNVFICIKGKNLHLEFENGTLIIWEISDLVFQKDLPKNLLRIEHGDYPPETLIIDNPEFKNSFNLKTVKNSFLYIPIFLTLILLIPTFIYWVIPYTSKSLAKFVPISIEVKIGNYIIEELFPNRRICKKDKGKKAALILLQNISPSSSKYDLKLEIVDSDLVNAIAFPGGKIIIFRGLLEASQSAEAVAGVISHEIQHIVQQHGTENFLNQIALSGIFKLLTLSENDFSATIFEGIKILSILRYSREIEKEADELALRMLFQKKIDPEKFLSLLILLKENSQSLPEIISTHPDITKRLMNLKKLIESNPKYVTKPIISQKHWENLRNICQKN